MLNINEKGGLSKYWVGTKTKQNYRRSPPSRIELGSFSADLQIVNKPKTFDIVIFL